MTLELRKIAALERDYRAGYGPNTAAIQNDIALGTARKYFARFVDLNIPRGPRRRYQHRTPIYTGPTWIGLPA